MPKANDKDVYYFSHDCNARNDERILAMRSIYGLEGYAMYFMIIEILREQTDFKLKDSKYLANTLSMQIGTDVEKIKKFLEDCCNEFGLFIQKDDYIYSESLIKRMGLFKEISKKRKDAAQKRWENMQNVCKCNANAYDLHNENEENVCKPDANAMQMQCNCNAKVPESAENGMQNYANNIKLNYTKLDYTKKDKIRKEDINIINKNKKEKEAPLVLSDEKPPDENERDKLGKYLDDTVFKYKF